MAFDTEQKILDVVDKKEKDSEIIGLRDRFERDYSDWRLTPFQLGNKSEYENYTSNEPRNLAGKIIDTLSTAPIQCRIPLELDDEEERKRKSNAERFVYGALSLADFRLQSMLSPHVLALMSWYACLRGMYGTFCYIHKDAKGKTIPDIKVFDPLHLTWEIGTDGLLWRNHKRKITKEQAEAEFGKKIATKDTFVLDFWTDEINAIIVNKEFFKKPAKHGLDHDPFLISGVGATPFIQSRDMVDTLRDSFESVYASNRNIFPYKNKMMTLLMSIVALGAHNPLAISSSGGKKTFQKSPYYKGAVVQLDSDKGEKVEELYKPELPKDGGFLLANLQRDLNIGGQSEIASGQLDFQLPYSGIKELMDAARAIIKPRQDAIERSLEWVARELLTQFGSGGFGKLRLHGRDGTQEYFDLELSSKDIKGDWFPEVKLLPVLPEDEAQKHASAKLLVDAGLLAPQTAMDKFLGIQDTDAEMQKILVFRAKQLPAVQVREYVMALITEGRYDLANAVMKDYYSMMSEQTAPGGKASEAVEPQFASGMPNTAVTPEQMGKRQRPPGEREKFRGNEIAPL